MFGVNHQLSADLLRGAELLRDQWWSVTVEGVAQGAVYALLAVGCTLVHRRNRAVDLGQLAVFSLGVFSTYAAFFALGFRPGATPDVDLLPLVWFLFLGLAAAVLVSGVASTGLELVVYRGLGGRGPWLRTLVGLAVFVVVQQGLRLAHGSEAERPIRLFRPVEFMPGVDDLQLLSIVVGLGLIAAASAVLAKHPAWAFPISGALMGAAGTLYLLKVPTAAWHMTGVQLGLYAVAAVFLGGLGNIRGAVVAALALGVVQASVQTVISDRWRYLLAIGLLVFALLLRWWRTRRQRGQPSTADQVASPEAVSATGPPASPQAPPP